MFSTDEVAVVTTREFDPEDNESIRIIAAVQYGSIVTTCEYRGNNSADMALHFQNLLEFAQDRADWVAPTATDPRSSS